MKRGIVYLLVIIIGSCGLKKEEKGQIGVQPKKDTIDRATSLTEDTIIPPAPTSQENRAEKKWIQVNGSEFEMKPIQFWKVLYPLDSLMTKRLGKVDHVGQYYYGIQVQEGDTTLIATFNDENEYASIILFTLRQGQAVSSLVVAENRGWEHNYRITKARFNSDSTLVVTTYQGGKDFGDYQTWQRDTTITTYWITAQGNIIRKEK